jgi:peptidoglycan/LPS O-acetylase OafA/YrhL
VRTIASRKEEKCLPSELGLRWTLASEVTFYLIVPFVLRSPRLAAVLVAGSPG